MPNAPRPWASSPGQAKRGGTDPPHAGAQQCGGKWSAGGPNGVHAAERLQQQAHDREIQELAVAVSRSALPTDGPQVFGQLLSELRLAQEQVCPRQITS